MVEAAVLIPVLLLILLGMVQVGLAIKIRIGVADGVNAGAIYGSLSAANAANSSAIETRVSSGGDVRGCGSLTVTSQVTKDADNENLITVSAECEAPMLVPVPGMGNSLTLRARSVRKIRP
jgi:hypothetical protein